jgi:hypothetical protein
MSVDYAIYNTSEEALTHVNFDSSLFADVAVEQTSTFSRNLTQIAPSIPTTTLGQTLTYYFVKPEAVTYAPILHIEVTPLTVQTAPGPGQFIRFKRGMGYLLANDINLKVGSSSQERHPGWWYFVKYALGVENQGKRPTEEVFDLPAAVREARSIGSTNIKIDLKLGFFFDEEACAFPLHAHREDIRVEVKTEVIANLWESGPASYNPGTVSASIVQSWLLLETYKPTPAELQYYIDNPLHFYMKTVVCILDQPITAATSITIPAKVPGIVEEYILGIRNSTQQSAGSYLDFSDQIDTIQLKINHQEAWIPYDSTYYRREEQAKRHFRKTGENLYVLSFAKFMEKLASQGFLDNNVPTTIDIVVTFKASFTGVYCLLARQRNWYRLVNGKGERLYQ